MVNKAKRKGSRREYQMRDWFKELGFRCNRVILSGALGGKFSGDLFVQETLTVKATANISGDVIIGKLSVEPGATFNASCSMKGAIKELNQNEQQQPIEKTA